MKLVRFGPAGREKPGIIDSNGRIRDLSSVVPDITGDVLGPQGLAKIRKGDKAAGEADIAEAKKLNPEVGR